MSDFALTVAALLLLLLVLGAGMLYLLARVWRTVLDDPDPERTPPDEY